MSAATQRTLELLRKWEWNYWCVESYNAFSGRRTDMFNIIDYVAITPFSTIGIQSCGTGFSDHMHKLLEDEGGSTACWLACPNRLLILIGWRKVLIRKGMKQRVWKPRIAWIYLEDNKLIFEEKETLSYGKQEW